MSEAAGNLRDARALFEVGLDRFAEGNQEEAIVALREALAIDPLYLDAAHGLIRALDRAGRNEEALAEAEALIAREPKDVLARTSMSMIFQRMGRVAEAEKAALEAKILGWKVQLGEQGSANREQDGVGLRVLYVATTNAGKMRDFGLASGGWVRLEALPGLGGIGAPAEDEETFEGNAGVKARYYSGFAPGEIVVADDSGLEVDALGGAPGVRSARFAEDREPGTGIKDRKATVDERNNLCLLEALRGVEERGARYRCVLAAARDGVVIGTASGTVEGRILEEPRGSGGFGYDPLFYVGERGCTMAEMEGEARLEVSHRGRALVGLLEGMGL